MVYGNNKYKDSLRIKYLFEIPDRDKALECYRYFNERNNKLYQQRNNQDGDKNADSKDKAESGSQEKSFDVQEQMKIFFQRDESVLERHADDEAELYEKMQQIEHD